MPATAEPRHAEHQLANEQARQSGTAGSAGWEVRVDMPSHRAAVALAERLRAEGRPVIRRGPLYAFTILMTVSGGPGTRFRLMDA